MLIAIYNGNELWTLILPLEIYLQPACLKSESIFFQHKHRHKHTPMQSLSYNICLFIFLHILTYLVKTPSRLYSTAQLRRSTLNTPQDSVTLAARRLVGKHGALITVRHSELIYIRGIFNELRPWEALLLLQGSLRSSSSSSIQHPVGRSRAGEGRESTVPSLSAAPSPRRQREAVDEDVVLRRQNPGLKTRRLRGAVPEGRLCAAVLGDFFRDAQKCESKSAGDVVI